MSDSRETRLKRRPSKAKSDVALKKKRIGGKFVPADPEAAKKKKEELDRLRIASEGFNETDLITDEDREYFGSDSKMFFERALQKAPTWYEALKYAKELKPLQHASLQSLEVKQEVEIKDARVLWMWGDAQEVIQGVATTLIQQKAEDAVSDTIQAEQNSGTNTPEPEKV